MSKVHTLVVGDTHMKWPAFLRVLHHFLPKVCIVAGDFGWWPNSWMAAQYKGEYEKSLLWFLEKKPRHTQIRFIEGNHEDLDNLFRLHRSLTDNPFEAVELYPDLWFQPRGSTFELADGRTVFFCGGGKSVDNAIREKGISWFPQEEVSRDELPKTLPQADLVISHTVPNVSGVFDTLTPLKQVCEWWDDTPDKTCTTLDYVWETLHPKLWLASHLHVFRETTYEGTKFIVLDRTDGGDRPWNYFTYVLIDRLK